MAKSTSRKEDIQVVEGEAASATDDGGQKMNQGDLATLRDILFGAQAQAMESRLADLERRVVQANEELAAGITDLNHKVDEQVTEIQVDSAKRDDGLRQQLMAIVARLDEQKTSREDLSELLINMGKELQQPKKSSLVDSGNAESE